MEGNGSRLRLPTWLTNLDNYPHAATGLSPGLTLQVFRLPRLAGVTSRGPGCTRFDRCSGRTGRAFEARNPRPKGRSYSETGTLSHRPCHHWPLEKETPRINMAMTCISPQTWCLGFSLWSFKRPPEYNQLLPVQVAPLIQSRAYGPLVWPRSFESL